jgi:hypothetical protein
MRKVAGWERARVADSHLERLLDEIRPVVIDVFARVLRRAEDILDDVRKQERALAARIGIRYTLPTETERALYFLIERLQSQIAQGGRNLKGDVTPRFMLRGLMDLDAMAKL